MSKPKTITSRNKCPVCGCRKWWMLDGETKRRIGEGSGRIIDRQNVSRLGEMTDECANCGTVVTG